VTYLDGPRWAWHHHGALQPNTVGHDDGRLLNVFTTIKLAWADSGYDGKPLATWFRSAGQLTLEAVKRTELHIFKVVPRRWVVERTFGWLLRYRRLVRDDERRPEHHEAMVYWATVNDHDEEARPDGRRRGC
jgi:transposase